MATGRQHIERPAEGHGLARSRLAREHRDRAPDAESGHDPIEHVARLAARKKVGIGGGLKRLAEGREAVGRVSGLGHVVPILVLDDGFHPAISGATGWIVRSVGIGIRRHRPLLSVCFDGEAWRTPCAISSSATTVARRRDSSTLYARLPMASAWPQG